jgi:glyoxylase-like metal-dependent hydrolase (beta-lactamase superfamily II)
MAMTGSGRSLHGTLARRGARLAHVLDTHTHADHLSGVRRLARATGATVLAHALSKLQTAGPRLRGGETVSLGSKQVSVLDAPGHTPDSLALLVDGHLFTGDALFAGGAGRTDFPGGSASDLFDTSTSARKATVFAAGPTPYRAIM